MGALLCLSVLIFTTYFLRTNFALEFLPRYKYEIPVFISILSIGSRDSLSSLEADGFGFRFLQFFLFFGWIRRVDFELARASFLACCLSCEIVRFACACRDLLFLSDSRCCIVIRAASLLCGSWLLKWLFSSFPFNSLLWRFAMIVEGAVFNSESSLRTACSVNFSFFLNNL